MLLKRCNLETNIIHLKRDDNKHVIRTNWGTFHVRIEINVRITTRIEDM